MNQFFVYPLNFLLFLYPNHKKIMKKGQYNLRMTKMYY